MAHYLPGTVDVTLAVESNETAVADVPTAASIVTSTSSFLPRIMSRAWETFLSWLFTSNGSKYAAVADVTHWMVLTVKDSGAGISKVRVLLVIIDSIISEVSI